MQIDLKQLEVWFVTGSQHLYGPDTLEHVAQHSGQIAQALDEAAAIPVRVVFKSVLTTPDEILRLCREANNAERCVGLITWMHTFSPAKMWIAGLRALQKPLLHLHTQYNRDIPWAEIDMDFMNLNQAAHGDREFGFIGSRMRLERKVVVGHWQDLTVQAGVGAWARAASAWNDAQGARFARFGDNMREVAVTEGDKVNAQMRLGYSVSGYGVGDLVRFVREVSDAEIDALVQLYDKQYVVATALRVGGERHTSLREGARIELGLRYFLEDGGFKGFTTTFEDLHGLVQLPGLGPQRLMADGYGFAGEGDWKTAALVRATLELVPVETVTGVPNLPTTLLIRSVLTDLGAKSPLESGFNQQPIRIGTSDTIRIEIGRIVNTWQGPTGRTQTIFLQTSPEGASWSRFAFGSTGGIAPPRLRITYIKSFPFEAP